MTSTPAPLELEELLRLAKPLTYRKDYNELNKENALVATGSGRFAFLSFKDESEVYKYFDNKLVEKEVQTTNINAIDLLKKVNKDPVCGWYCAVFTNGFNNVYDIVLDGEYLNTDQMNIYMEDTPYYFSDPYHPLREGPLTLDSFPILLKDKTDPYKRFRLDIELTT